MGTINRIIKNTIRTLTGFKLIRISDYHFLLSKVNAKKMNLSVKLDRTRYSMDIVDLINRYEIDVVLDIGANVGQFAMMLRESGYKNRIISFEPSQRVFEELRTNSSKYTDWDVVNIALGSVNGEKTFHCTQSSEFSSFLAGNDQGSQIFGSQVGVNKDELVIVKRLDEVLPDMIQNVNDASLFVKMDTQGYDLEVFAGFGALKDNIKILQSEVSIIPIYEGMPHITKSILEFEKAGFKIVGFYSVTRQKSSLASIELDMVMIHT